MSKPVIARTEPCIVELQAGKSYWWCVCGRSKNQPFCDGSHQGTGLEPLEFVEEKGGKRALCCCKQTGDRPYCDGTHMKVTD